MTEKEDTTPQDNLRLWKQVEATDPSFTRGFSGSDGFNGTGINPTYNIRKATEAFGPIGIGWGYDILSEEYVKGVPLGFDADGNMWGNVLVHVLRLKLWYKLDGERGEVTHFGQTTFIGKGQNGLYTDEDAPKKSLTDAIAKCLSLLGFSADVFMGRYDDNKYVEAMSERFADKSRTATPELAMQGQKPAAVRPTPALVSVASNSSSKGDSNDPKAWIERIKTFGEDAQLDNARTLAPKYFKGDVLKEIRAAIDAQQCSNWLKRIPLLSKSNLNATLEKATKTFAGEQLTAISNAIDARAKSFADLKPAAGAAAA